MDDAVAQIEAALAGFEAGMAERVDASDAVIAALIARRVAAGRGRAPLSTRPAWTAWLEDEVDRLRNELHEARSEARRRTTRKGLARAIDRERERLAGLVRAALAGARLGARRQEALRQALGL